MHDQTAIKTEGITEQLRLRPGVKAEVDEGYRGRANNFPYQVTPPPRKPRDDAGEGDKRAWREASAANPPAASSWNTSPPSSSSGTPLQRYTGRRATYAETHLAIAALVSDRAARRTTRHRHSTDIVLARQPPADHPPAKPPGEPAPISIAPEVVSWLPSVAPNG
jgi:hypothetical protein